MAEQTIGVLVMAYGTPQSADEIEAYYTDIRRGRAPSREQLADLARRYEAIGGLSPLNARSNEQLQALELALESRAPGRYKVAYGTKHARPSIAQAVAQLRGAGCAQLVGLVLAPHYSALSIGEYVNEATRAAAEHGLPARFITSWADDPALVEVLAQHVREARAQLSRGPANEVIFSAHSLPARVIEMGDPYPEELARTAALVAKAVGLASFGVAYQSASRTGEPWLSPSVLDVLEELAAKGTTGVVVCPVGFTSDHLEVLYDLDIEARTQARALGLEFVRTASLNAAPALFASLAGRVMEISA